jgi:hypothetical protein
MTEPATLTDSDDTDEMTERSKVIDVLNPYSGIALAAAWRGVNQFFGGEVERWQIIPPEGVEEYVNELALPSKDREKNRQKILDEFSDGIVVAYGFSVDSDYDPERILSDLGGRSRRLPFFPFNWYVNHDREPEPYTDPQDMTNFVVLYMRGAVEAGTTSKAPDYAREAIQRYKAEAGIKTRRGPRRKIIRLDELDKISAGDIDPEQLRALVALAQKMGATASDTTVAIPEVKTEADEGSTSSAEQEEAILPK